MGLLTFAINLTADGCYDHREGIADDDLLRYFTRLMDSAGAMLYGRVTNTFHVEGELQEAVKRLKAETPRGILLGGYKLSAALERLGLIDDYRLVVHPVFASEGAMSFRGWGRKGRLELVSTQPLPAGALALHYRRAEG